MKHQFKVIVVGDKGTGKTSLLILSTYCHGEYPTNIGSDELRLDCFEKQFKANEYEILWLSFFDVIGSPSHLPDTFYHGAHGCILVFSTTDHKSFENVNHWLAAVREKCGDIPLVLVQTKLDLIDESALETDVVDAKAKDCKLRLYRVSAKENLNLDDLFAYIATKCKNFLRMSEKTLDVTEPGSRHSSAKSVNWDVDSVDAIDHTPTKRRTGGVKPVINRHKKVCSLM